MFPRPDSDFVTLHNPRGDLAPQTIEKIGPSTLAAWTDCNERATTTDAQTQAERDERDAGTRRLGRVFLGLAAGVGMLWLAVLL